MKLTESDKRCLEKFGWFYAFLLLKERELKRELGIKEVKV